MPQAIVLLATLACIEWLPEHKLPARLSFSYVLVSVPADGRCVWSSLWLATQASRRELFGWYKRNRTAQGIAHGEEDAKRERDLVCSWALNLPDLPLHVSDRLKQGACAEHDDIETQHIF